MTQFAKVLLVLSMLGFILAVISTLIQSRMMGITSEGFSRACTNLALIAVGISLICTKGPSTS